MAAEGDTAPFVSSAGCCPSLTSAVPPLGVNCTWEQKCPDKIEIKTEIKRIKMEIKGIKGELQLWEVLGTHGTLGTAHDRIPGDKGTVTNPFLALEECGIL